MKKVPYRTLHEGNIYGWANVFDQEPLNTVLRDYDLVERDLRNICEEYQFDLLAQNAFRNIPRVLDPLGFSNYTIDDATASVNSAEFGLMHDDEYEQIGNDYFKFAWEKMLPRKFEIFKDDSVALKAIYDSCKEWKIIQDKSAELNVMIEKEYGIPASINQSCPAGPMFGFDFLFLTARGIKPLLVDLRRRTSEFVEACQKLNSMYNSALYENEEVGSNENLLFDYMEAIMCQNFVNPKQFEMLYQPNMSKFFHYVADHDKTYHFFIEGSFMRFADILQDVPKGHISTFTENDDIFELRKKLPNICLEGGMPCLMLNGSSKEECVDRAQKLVDAIGANGGYILSQDKMMQYRNDGKPENMKAVADFVREYRG